MSELREAETSGESLLCPVVVGRERELRRLHDALEAARNGRGATVFLVGEAGIGKSRLVRETEISARHAGMAVVEGRAVQAPSAAAYRPLVEALAGAVRADGVPETPLLAPFRSVLGRLIPEWRAEARLGGEESLVELAEAVLRFLRAIAEGRGCLAVFEDLQWADPETLTVVEYLADNLRSEPVVVVATLRTEESGPALAFAQRLDDRRVVSVMHLGRLQASEVSEMVVCCLGSAESLSDAVALTSVAEGVPFLVEEVLAATAASGALTHDGASWRVSRSAEPVVPITFADSVRRRLRPLGPELRAVLSAAAVLGRNFDWSLLGDITGASDASVLQALRATIDTQLVDRDDMGFRFRHALTRDAILRDLLPPERAALSRQALAVIEARWPELPGDGCDLAAELSEATADRDRAASLWLQVSRRALDAGALASAEQALTRARVLAPRNSVQLDDIEQCLIDVVAQRGKTDDASAIGAALLERLPSDASALRAHVLWRLGRAMADAARWQNAQTYLDAARQVPRSEETESLTPALDALAARIAAGRHQLDVATAYAREALVTAERAGLPEVACEALEVIGRCARSRDLDAAEHAFAAAYAIAERHGMTVWRLRSLHELGTIDLLRDGGLDRLEAARDLAIRVGALAVGATVDVQIAAVLGVSDDPEQALVVAQRAADLARRFHLEATYAAARAFEAAAHARAGRADEMHRCIGDALAHAQGSPSIGLIPPVVEALLALRQERRAEAIRCLDSNIVEDLLSDQSPPTAGFRALLRVLDRGSGAGPIGEARAAAPVHFWGRAYLSYAEAIVAGRSGHPHEATATVAAGDEQLRRFNWLRHLGHRLVAEAAIGDGWGDPVGWLREALTFFERSGDRELASACRSLLRRAGAAVPRQRAGSSDVPVGLRAQGVTGREAEVLRLLAEGRSNAQIAAQLYLSPRTVERHVANLAVKTGVETRAQLVAFAARTVFGGSPASD